MGGPYIADGPYNARNIGTRGLYNTRDMGSPSPYITGDLGTLVPISLVIWGRGAPYRVGPYITPTPVLLGIALFYLYSICSLFLFFVSQFFPATTKYNNNDKFVIYAVLNLITLL